MFRKAFLPVLGLLAGLVLAVPLQSAHADAANQASPEEKFIRSLRPATGTVELPRAQATLKLADGYSFLRAKDAQRVITELWDNPPDTDVLGMILPSTDMHDLLEEDHWAVVMTFEDEGYVSDEEAAKIDYNDMLKDLQKETKEDNRERVKQGYRAIELVGWAEPPHYDAATHKLYWAEHLKFTGADASDEHQTLNYKIRVLGRKGYLSLNAVAPIESLAQVRADMPKVLAMADFQDGQRYTDYKPGVDKTAAYGIAALVAGGIAAKAGLFAKLGVLLLAFKKFVVIGVVAIGAGIAKVASWFKRKRA